MKEGRKALCPLLSGGSEALRGAIRPDSDLGQRRGDGRRGAQAPPSPSGSAETAVLTDPLQVNAAPSELSANSSHSAVFLYLPVFSFKYPVYAFIS